MFNLFYMLLGITAFFVVLAVLLFMAIQRQRSAVTKRVRTLIVRTDSEDESHMRSSEKMARKVSLIASIIRARMGVEQQNEATVQERFTAAGIRLPKVTDVYFVLRILTPILLGAGGWLATNKILFGIAGAIFGYVLPSFILDQLVKNYGRKIRRAMPDVVDLLVVCVEAGLGTEQAMLRAAREMSISYKEVSYEFLETNRQRQAGLSREQAWENMVKRTKLQEIETLVSMLNQTDELGTPLKVGLRNFANTLRDHRRIMAEETAARASVLLLIPLVLFIFPTVFVVIMGPAVLSLMNSLSNGYIPK